MKAATEMRKLPHQIGDPHGRLHSRGEAQHNDTATSGEPADRLTGQRPPEGINDEINPVGCEASESTGESLTLNVDNVDPPQLIVCSRSGCLRPHFRPSIASAVEQAEAYAALLPLIAGGEIVPAFDRSPLEEAPEALRHVIEDRPFGKVALTVGALADLRPYERPLALLQRRSPVL